MERDIPRNKVRRTEGENPKKGKEERGKRKDRIKKRNTPGILSSHPENYMLQDFFFQMDVNSIFHYGSNKSIIIRQVFGGDARKSETKRMLFLHPLGKINRKS